LLVILTLSESSSERVEALVSPQARLAISPERGINLMSIDLGIASSLVGSMPAIGRVDLSPRIGLSRATNLPRAAHIVDGDQACHRRIPGGRVSGSCCSSAIASCAIEIRPKHIEATSAIERAITPSIHTQILVSNTPRIPARALFWYELQSPIRLVLPDDAVDALNSGSPSLNRKG
jgi:hypothetical protein